MVNKVLSGNTVSDYRELGILQRRGFVSTVVFVTSLLLLAAGWIVKGDVEAAIRPDSDDFVRAGEAMLNWIASGGAGVEAMKAHAVYPHYFIPSVMLAGIHMYFSDPVVKVVALNAVLFSTLIVLLYQFWSTVHGAWSHWSGRQGFMIAGVGGFYIVFGLPDPFLLSYTVLTDIIFLFWVSVFVVVAAHAILRGGRAAWMIALVVAVTALYVRPTGILLPALFLYALIVKILVERGIEPRTLAVVSIGVPLVITLVIVPWLVAMKINGASWVNAVVPDIFHRDFNQAVYFFRNGIVVSDRLETYVDTPSSYIDVLKMVVHRLVYYWIPLRLGEAPYTLIHNIVNLVYVVIAWPLAVIGLRRLAGAGERYQVVAMFLVTVALSYAFMHSVTLLSFSWRYQLPAMVPLWMLAGIGLYTALGYPIRSRLEDAASRRVPASEIV